MKVLVTGGAGYIGSHLVKEMEATDYMPVVLDDFSTGHREAIHEDIIIQGGFGNFKDMCELISVEKIEAVVHLGGKALVGESVEEPLFYYETNLAGSLSLIRASRLNGVKRFLFASSCTVYANDQHEHVLSLDEQDSEIGPSNPYGRTKAAVEWAIQDYARAYGMGYAILRLFNVAGAHHSGQMGEDHDPETHLIPNAIKVAMGLKPHLDIYNPDAVRDYVHVTDVARAFIHCLDALRDSPQERIISNVGLGNGGHRNVDVVATVERVAGRPVPYIAHSARDGEAREAHARRPCMLEFSCGWKPRFTQLHQIIESAWKWHVNYPNGYSGGKIEEEGIVDTNPQQK